MYEEIRNDNRGRMEYLSFIPKGPICVSDIHPMWEESILTWRLHPAYNEAEAISELQENNTFTSLVEIIREGSDPDLYFDAEDGEYYPITHLTPAAREASSNMGTFLSQAPARKTLPRVKRFLRSILA
jgi:hypothetical protein